ncbi:type I toxin-antitoxin system Ibs family toxin [Citrobacter sp. FDAARGOS_156]|nr:type I toxin-antitoxin system Ibs family toxin [Citrobacter sp. FDAARGOS_156]
MRHCALECGQGKRRKAKDFSGMLERESPSRGRGQNKERVMMKYVIILVVLLVISLPAY